MMETIRADFDRLAVLEDTTGGWSHNDHYHPYLLRHIPNPCTESLEIGCGTGAFARLLARQSRHVLGLDLSPEMIRVARARSIGFSNLDYQVADVLEWPFPLEKFDCITSIATLHHLPLQILLDKMKAALQPAGALLVLDLFKAEDLSDLLFNAVAFPANLIMRLIKTRHVQQSQAQRIAWMEHGNHDHYLKVSAVRRICRDILPGSIIRKHLFWRYSLVWYKPVV
jgi:ubiquinone/menaquinone biosynthesis C-methylase UbiE